MGGAPGRGRLGEGGLINCAGTLAARTLCGSRKLGIPVPGN